VQSQVRFNRVPEKVLEKVWEALEDAEVFPELGFAARFRKIYKNKTLRLLGIPPKLISHIFEHIFYCIFFGGNLYTHFPIFSPFPFC